MKKRYWYTFTYKTSDMEGNAQTVSLCARPTAAETKRWIDQIKHIKNVDEVLITSVWKAN
jgi:hypothetical protein